MCYPMNLLTRVSNFEILFGIAMWNIILGLSAKDKKATPLHFEHIFLSKFQLTLRQRRNIIQKNKTLST